MIDPISAFLHRQTEGHPPLVLMYHSVCEHENKPTWQWSVSRRNFRNQLDFLLERGWETSCIRDLQNNQERKNRTIIITFDDGYADNYWAFEQLVQRNMKATWFIVSRDIGRMSGWKDPGVPARMLLNADQLHEMDISGMEIASHSHRHVRLSRLNEQSMEEEARESKRILEDVLGTEVSSFAYPYGDLDQRAIDAVKKAGYLRACATRPGWLTENFDPYRIPRISVLSNDNIGSFARKLTFADNDVSWLKMTRYARSRIYDRIQRVISDE